MNKDEQNKIPVLVSVASEQEPVTVEGELTQNLDGFALEFKLGSDSFTVLHAEKATQIKADGVMAYDITLSDEKTSTLLATPYGKIRFDVITVTRRVTSTNDGFKILLAYELNNDAAGKIARAVDVTVHEKL